MSSTQWVLRIAPTGVAAMTFAGAQLLGGIPGLSRAWTSEVLRADGADGVRYRRVSRQAKVLRFRAWEPVYGAVEDQISLYDRAPGNLATVQVELRNWTATYSNAYVVGWSTVQVTGELFGFGAVSGSDQTIVSEWEIDVSQGGS